jgi:hypothetical protein
MGFKREFRYFVFKVKDLLEMNNPTLGTKLGDDTIAEFQCIHGKLSRRAQDREYVVIENDWPEYEQVWRMIEMRMSGLGSDKQDLLEQNVRMKKDLEVLGLMLEQIIKYSDWSNRVEKIAKEGISRVSREAHDGK